MLMKRVWISYPDYNEVVRSTYSFEVPLLERRYWSTHTTERRYEVPTEAPILERRHWSTHNTGNAREMVWSTSYIGKRFWSIKNAEKMVWSTYWSFNIGKNDLKCPQYWKDGLKYLLKPQYRREGSEVPKMLERWSDVPIEALMLERRLWSTHNDVKMVWSTYLRPNFGEKALKYPQYWEDGLKYLLKPQCWNECSEVPTILERRFEVPIEAPMLERMFWSTHNTGKTVWSTYWSPNVGKNFLKYPQYWKDGLKYLLKPQCWKECSEVPTILERRSKVPIEAPMLERMFWSTHNAGKMV